MSQHPAATARPTRGSLNAGPEAAQVIGDPDGGGAARVYVRHTSPASGLVVQTSIDCARESTTKVAGK